MPPEFPFEVSAKVALVFIYLTTIQFWRSTRILSLWDHRTVTFEDFAEEILAGIPLQYFQVPLPFPTGPRYIISRGMLSFDPQGRTQMAQILPSDIDHLLREWGPIGVPANPPPTRTRTLNSFMACRTFLAPVFRDTTQKTKSQLISLIWLQDPFKPQWAVLAQSYSHLRDHFELDDPSLSLYIQVTKEFFNFPSPELYLMHVGWELQKTPCGDFNLSKCLPRATFNLPHEAVSVDDILNFCSQIPGYANKRAESMWPATLDLRPSLVAVNTRGYVPDPYRWLFDDRGNLRTFDEFTLEQMYGTPDGDMDEVHDAIYTPIYEQQLLEERAESHANTINEVSPQDFLTDQWSSWNQCFPAASAVDRSV
ncbi:Mating type protein [Penicillium angulare]|uniref:Mating type protein n=1 Tax=Penicillium angulare TaxID=116970 RepID=UPI002540E8A0|nr:Mating type protein [Penicillium angulare]KAJ5288568.1 Mating type protein [Penicillium angulare]